MSRTSFLQRGSEFNITGLRTLVAGSSVGTFPGRVVIASRIIPAGAQAFLERWSAKVIDVGNADQIYFAILRNGSPLNAQLARIPAIQFDYQAQVEIGELVYAGTIEIVAFNISGMLTTIEPDAAAVAVDVACQAWLFGSLLSERGGQL